MEDPKKDETQTGSSAGGGGTETQTQTPPAPTTTTTTPSTTETKPPPKIEVEVKTPEVVDSAAVSEEAQAAKAELVQLSAQVESLKGENTQLKALMGGIKEDLFSSLSDTERAEVEDIAQIGGGTDEALIRAALKMQRKGLIGKPAPKAVPEVNDEKASAEPGLTPTPKTIDEARAAFDKGFAGGRSGG